MSLTYWPNAEYAQTDKNIKRLKSSTPFPSFSKALSKLNSWSNDVNILWAWIDIKDGNKKVEKVKLSKDSDGVWSGEPHLTPPSSDISAEDISAGSGATQSLDRGEASVKETTALHRPLKRYDTATKLAMVARIKAEGIMAVSRETGISAVSLRAWKRQVKEGKLVPAPTLPDDTSQEDVPILAQEDVPILTQEDAQEASEVAMQRAPEEAPEHTPQEAQEDVQEYPESAVDTRQEFGVEPLQLSMMGDEPISIKRRKPVHYSFEVKLAAITRAREVGVATAAKELGIRESVLYRWRREAGAAAAMPTAVEQKEEQAEQVGGRVSFEMKLAILDRVKEQGTAFVSRQTGIPLSTLRRWIKEAGPGFFPDDAPGSGNTPDSFPMAVIANTSDTTPASGEEAEPVPGTTSTPKEEPVPVKEWNGSGTGPVPSEEVSANGNDVEGSVEAKEEAEVSAGASEKHVYTDEEKLAILDMVATDGFVTVSKELGIPKSTLRSWKRRAKRGLITVPEPIPEPTTTVETKSESAEDKETVLALVAELGVEAVSREMGIPEDVIRKWKAEALSQSTSGAEATPEAHLIAALEKENEELKIQVALLEAKVARYKRAIEALIG